MGGVPDEMVGQGEAGTQHAEQPHGRALVVGDLTQQRVAVVDGVREAASAERQIRVRGAAEQREQWFGRVA